MVLMVFGTLATILLLLLLLLIAISPLLVPVLRFSNAIRLNLGCRRTVLIAAGSVSVGISSADSLLRSLVRAFGHVPTVIPAGISFAHHVALER